MGLRERQKSQRQQQILAAARDLVRGSASTEFSMKQLADLAAVSLVTPYNLFGSKSGVLYALLNDSLERLGRHAVAGPDSDTREDVLSLAGIAAAEYVDDAGFFRPLLQYLLGVPDREHRPRLLARSLQRWSSNVEAAVVDGTLDAAVNIDILARQLLITFIGAVELWVLEELDDESFIVQSLYGSAVIVNGFVNADARTALRQRINAYEQRLPRQLDLPGQSADRQPDKPTQSVA